MDGITPDNLKKDGWEETGFFDEGCGKAILWSKKVNNKWFDLYYSNIDEDYMLVKHIAVVDSMKELNELITKNLNHTAIDTVNIQDCNPKNKPVF